MVWFEDGKIKTDLGDQSFFELIWRKWGEYNEGEIDALSAAIDSEELTDEWLMNEGFDILESKYFVGGEMITLIKVGVKEWVIQDASPEEMEEFVQSLV